MTTQESQAGPNDTCGADRRLELAEGVGEAVAVSVAALAGPVAGLLVAVGISGNQSLTVRRWRSHLERRLAQVERQLNPEDPLTAAVFTRFTLAAAQTADRGKLDLLVNGLLSTDARRIDGDYLLEHFAGLIARFSTSHVRVLQVISEADRNGLDLRELNAVELLRVLETSDTDVDYRLIVGVIWDELVSEGLVQSDSVSSFHNHQLDERAEVGIHAITPMGSQFLRYLAAHPNVGE